jgi:hypothetical protein
LIYPLKYRVDLNGYAELASDCNLGIRNQDLNDKEITDIWTGSTNARNYAVFGDPAVRITVTPGFDYDISTRNSRVWFKRSNKQTEEHIQQLQDRMKKLIAGLRELCSKTYETE